MTERQFANAYCTASATDTGATVTSWHPRHGHEALFVSSKANPAGLFHGGIPICAPWFGVGRGETVLPRLHGLVRSVDWHFLGAKQAGFSTKASWTLEATSYAHLPGAELYPKDLHYRCEVTFGRELEIALTITSPSQEAIVDNGFHSYFLVNALSTTQLRGITADPFSVTAHHDEIYFGAGGNQLAITMPDREITIAAEGAQDVVVWNPGPAMAAELPDFDEQEWSRMLCVEVGNIQHHALTIPAGESRQMTLRIGIT